MERISFKNFIQVAGIIDQQEAELIIETGVKYLGFPLRLPINKEDLSESESKKIISKFLPPTYGVAISYSNTALQAIELCNKIGSKIIQLHGPISISEIKIIRELEPKITIIKSLVIKQNNEEELAKSIKKLEPFVDAFITDTFNPITGASGATGKKHDWDISKRFVSLSSKPLILAGGLNPDNVYDGILKVKPAGVDVHTGVEDNSGRKDKRLLRKFVEEATIAFQEISNDN